MIIFILISFISLLLAGFPIIAAMGIPSIIYFIIKDIPFSIVSYSIFQALNTFTLVAVPMFILMGNLVNEFNETERMFQFARIVLGNKKGYSARINVFLSLIFSGISGAALADIGGLGQIEIRAMENEGFSREYAAALTAATSTVGPIFPPSIPLIIYALTAEISTLRALIAGALPGLLIALVLYFFVLYQIPHQLPHKRLKPLENLNQFDGNKKTFTKSLVSALPMLIAVPVIILSMLFGVFSPTEAGAAGVIYLIGIGFFHKEISIAKIRRALTKTYQSTSNILLIVSIGFLFTKVLTLEQFPKLMAKGVFGITENPIIILLMINIIGLIMGMFMEGISCIVILTPIFLPIANQIGVDPLHLGVILVLNFMIGLSTPPFGLGVYTVSSVGHVAPEKVFRAILPLYIPLIISLLIVTFCPILSLWLVNIFFQ